MTRFSRPLAALIAGSILAGASFALAHGGATGIVKERMELMKGIGERMKILTSVFKGEVDYDPEAVKQAAAGIRDHAGAKVIELFPEGSLDKPTEALPAIWKNWELFEQLAGQLEGYSDALVQAADNPRGPDDGMFGQGMMAEGQGMMMSQGQNMITGQDMMTGQGMMMDGAAGAGPDPATLVSMPPQAAFMHLAETCNTCHTRFRVKKEH